MILWMGNFVGHLKRAVGYLTNTAWVESRGSVIKEAITPGTEPEVIDAQYGCGRRIRDVLMSAHLASYTCHEDGTSTQYRPTPSVLNILTVYLAS